MQIVFYTVFLYMHFIFYLTLIIIDMTKIVKKHFFAG